MENKVNNAVFICHMDAVLNKGDRSGGAMATSSLITLYIEII